uniref:Domain of unknown function DB domain-containing protein n=1 Tax=Acrobeloides nanus TaxID=290746 RepID=A0A914DY79_9BILA
MTFPIISDSCAASGCCAPPPPPAPACAGGGCPGGYACGGYGCHRVRAKGSRTFNTGDDDTHSYSERRPSNPDEAFLDCCITQQLPDSCLNKCNFRTYTKDALQNMYFKADACPLEAAGRINYCAAQGRDHRQCCARNGMTSTLAGPKCLVLCDQRPGQILQLDLSYVPCYDRFENMKSCFYHDIVQRMKRTYAYDEAEETETPNEESGISEFVENSEEFIPHAHPISFD